jgi:methylamine--corrinoid protein Co-methyltransferase
MAITIAKAVALERIDSLVPFNLTTLAGRRLHGMPHEVLANRQQIAWSREAVRLAGKPGLHICNYPIATTAPAILAILHPDFIRKTDAVMISPLPEPFKINYDCLTAAIVAHEYGCFVWSDARSYIGGYAGGYESTLAVGCAAPLINITVLRAHYALWSAGFPLPEPKLQALDKVRWTYNMALQALKRNTRLLLANSSCTAAEPCTEQQLIEMASRVISHTASGASAFWAGRPVKPLRLNLVTPLEIRWVIEVSRAARKLNRRQANEISKALNVPEEKLRNPPTGKAFQECFDVTSLKPNKEYVDLYNRVKKKVEDLGLKFED